MFGARGRPATPTQQGLVIGAAFFIVYLLTRTRDLAGDDAAFASAVESFLAGKGIPREVFHPHHPLFNPIVAAVTWVVRVLGFHPIVADVGAAVAAFFAAAVIAALVPLLRRAGIREGPALLTAAVAGASGGLWQFGTCMEVYTLTAAAVLIWLAVVGRPQPDPQASAGALAAAVLGHLAAGLLVVPTAIRFRRRPRAMLLAVCGGLGVAGIVEITNFVVFHHAYTPRAWLRTVLPGYMDQYLEHATQGTIFHALADLAVWGWYHSVALFSPTVAGWLDVIGLLAEIVLAVTLAAGVVVAVRERHPLAVTAALALAAYVPLWLVWDVGNVEHTVAATPLFATLIAFGIDALPRRVGAPLLGTVLAGLLVVNGLASAVPQSRPENAREWVIASFVAEHVPRDGVVLSVGVDPRLRLSLPYLAGRRVVMLSLDVDSARKQGRSPLDGLAYWLRAGSQAPSIWLTPDVLDAASVAWVERMGIPGQTWSRVLGAARPVERHVLAADGVVIRKPFVLTRIVLTR
jgi:hypothetical protein